MKKIYYLLGVVGVLICCCACGRNSNEDIIGYWMRGDGYTISFVDETNCCFGEEELRTYTIYDDNHLQTIDLLGNNVTEFIFEVDGETLNIRLSEEEEYTLFTKNEEEQKKILEEVKEQEAIAQEEQRLQTQIDSCWEQVADIQKDIDGNNSAIENNTKDIEEWEAAIEQRYMDCQEAIDFGDDKVYQENLRDDFVDSCNESIQRSRDRIKQLEEENVGYQAKIDLIHADIEKLQKEKEELQK